MDAAISANFLISMLAFLAEAAATAETFQAVHM